MMSFWDKINPIGWIKSALEPIADVAKGPINEWQKRKTVKAEAEAEVIKINAQVEITKANIMLEMAKKGQQIEADWDRAAQEQAKNSWKDEFLMIVLFFPVIALFVCSLYYPEKINTVIDSVKALDKFPFWYQVILWGVVAFVFGLRWLIKPLVDKISGQKVN